MIGLSVVVLVSSATSIGFLSTASYATSHPTTRALNTRSEVNSGMTTPKSAMECWGYHLNKFEPLCCAWVQKKQTTTHAHISVVGMNWPTHWSRSDDLTFSIHSNIRPTQGLRNENIWFAFFQLWMACREALKVFDSFLLELAWHRKRIEPNLNINQIRWYIPKLLCKTY